MKVESRGKYPGVKLHLEPEEVAVILGSDHDPYHTDAPEEELLVAKMKKKILQLKKDTPNLLQERTPEEVAAILVKEVEKATLQLDHVKRGAAWQKLDPALLKAKLLTYVKE